MWKCCLHKSPHNNMQVCHVGGPAITKYVDPWRRSRRHKIVLSHVQISSNVFNLYLQYLLSNFASFPSLMCLSQTVAPSGKGPSINYITRIS